MNKFISLLMLLVWLPIVNGQKTTMEATFVEKVNISKGDLSSKVWEKAKVYQLHLLKYDQRN
jgi:hypothetical protein